MTRMTMWSWVVLLAMAAGCGGGSGGARGAAPDAAEDLGAGDVVDDPGAGDLPGPDLAHDVAPDSPADVLHDAPDAADVGPDLVVDDCLTVECVYGDDWAFLTAGVETLDSGGALPSNLIVHGADAFPVVVDEGGHVFIAATRHGAGRVVVFGHEGYLKGAATNESDFGVLVRNAVEWVGGAPGASIGAAPGLSALADFLTAEGLTAGIAGTDGLAGLDVFCLESSNGYSDAELTAIAQFVADGGGLVVGGQAWWWSYSNPDTTTNYPGNKILNAMGITYTPFTDVSAGLDTVGGAPPSVLHHATKALDLLLLDEAGAVTITDAEKALGAQQAGAAIDLLPFSFEAFFDKAMHFKQGMGPVVPTPADPVHKATDYAEVLVVHLDMRLALELPPGEVEGHPAAAAFPGLPGDGAAPAGWTGVVDGDHVGLDPKFGFSGPQAPARRGTGRYAAPGAVITVTIPAAAAGEGLEVMIGAHSDQLWGKDAWHRIPRIVRSFPLDAAATEAASAFGGPVYVLVPAGSELGPVEITVTGAIPMPRYVHGETDPADWVAEIRDRPAPWAELESDRFIATIPAADVRELDAPDAVMAFWDEILDADADLAGLPHDRPRAERIVADVQISAGALHSGYPVMGHLDVGPTFTDLAGLFETGDWGIFHELGHNHQWSDWIFKGTIESSVNLWSVYGMEEVVGLSRDLAHPAISPEARQQRLEDYMAGGADFADWEVWVALETYLQLQEGFGWAPFTALFQQYYALPPAQTPWDDVSKIDLWAMGFSALVGKDLGPFFETWGLPISDEAKALVSDLDPWLDDPMAAYR